MKRLTRREAAAYLRKSLPTLDKLLRAGKIEYYKEEGEKGRIYVSEEALERYIESTKVVARPPVNPYATLRKRRAMV